MLSHRPLGTLALLAAIVCGTTVWTDAAPQSGSKPKRPEIRVRANPPYGFVPAKIVLTAELTGGSNDFEDYYCAKVEWDWADQTTSEMSYDCDPYEAGKSEIRRRFTAEHVFRTGGTFEVAFRLKQGTKVVGSARTTVQIRDETAGPITSSEWPVLSRGRS